MNPLPLHQRHKAVELFISRENLNGVTLRFAKESDAKFILSLRLDPTRNKHVSSVSGSIDVQKKWLVKYREREQQGLEFYFIIEKDKTAIGTVRLYDIKEDSFCWGSWMIVNGSSPRIAISSTELIYKIGFDVLGFKQSHFDVRKGNRSVNRFHQRMGAETIGEDIDNTFYRISDSSVDSYFKSHSR